MNTMHPLQYHQRKSCIQAKHELLQIVHCSDNWNGTLYILGFESSNKYNMEKVKKKIVFCGYIRTVFTTEEFLKLKLAIKSRPDLDLNPRPKNFVQRL